MDGKSNDTDLLKDRADSLRRVVANLCGRPNDDVFVALEDSLFDVTVRTSTSNELTINTTVNSVASTHAHLLDIRTSFRCSSSRHVLTLRLPSHQTRTFPAHSEAHYPP